MVTLPVIIYSNYLISAKVKHIIRKQNRYRDGYLDFNIGKNGCNDLIKKILPTFLYKLIKHIF